MQPPPSCPGGTRGLRVFCSFCKAIDLEASELLTSYVSSKTCAPEFLGAPLKTCVILGVKQARL